MYIIKLFFFDYYDNIEIIICEVKNENDKIITNIFKITLIKSNIYKINSYSYII